MKRDITNEEGHSLDFETTKLLSKEETLKEFTNEIPLEYLWKHNNTWHDFNYVSDSITDLLKCSYKFRLKDTEKLKKHLNTFKS